jgi:hypothetical protein
MSELYLWLLKQILALAVTFLETLFLKMFRNYY